jgi:protein SCO1/2/putative membrane protein
MHRLPVICLLVALLTPPARADDLSEVQDFSLTERSGRTVTRQDLLGKVWVASFIFTRCAGSCPQISRTMRRLQDQTAGQEDVVLVSISVDPNYDTPAFLRDYADKRYHADPERWLFLTGDRDAVYGLIQNSFLLGVQETEGPEYRPGNEVTHSSRLALVDQRGHIRGYFDGREVDDDGNPVDDLPRLEREIAALRGRDSRLPAVNAVLNATCAMLLVLGLFAIRRRWVRFHETCMLLALAVSAVFLVSYLYYHFGVLHGRATRFAERVPTDTPAWIFGLYYGVLATHTVLAAVVAPLAPLTAALGLTGRLTRHVWLARWTLPVWLYVSVTGVAVYWMLYRLYPSP